jgi:ERCC4-related helicase
VNVFLLPDSDSPAPLSVSPGSVVVIRDEEWVVQAVEVTADGPMVRVQGLSELVRDTEATFYESLDEIVPMDPSQAVVRADGSPHYRTARLWMESMIRKTARPLADPDLSVSAGALVDVLSYQESAVRQALDPANLRPRILLADAVGLGKTIEIGMILSELVRRGRGDRILIVTPRHVLEQMQHEMWVRFSLPFVRLDSAGIQRVRQKLPATRNPFTFFRRVIISIDTLKSDRYISHLSKQRWDAVVIDEAHNLSNDATLNNRLARVLARNCDALILASATPHNGKKESFAELIRLLDPSAVSPAGELDEAEVKRLVIRRHRHSPQVAAVVGADWAERTAPLNLLVVPSAAEDAIAHELDDVWLHPRSGNSPTSGQNSRLFPWTLAKAFLSSSAALLDTVRERKKRLTLAGADPDGVEIRALTQLESLAVVALEQPSAKFERLVQHLEVIGVAKASPERVVIFSERIATLHWLKANLSKALGISPDAIEVMHGGLADDEQQRIVEEFKLAHTPVRVLLTGDVASEGVNLHSQCHELVHYDIPWSLIRIEQRNGRIDRYGQRSSPRITTLILDPSSEGFAGDIRVLAKLIDKEFEAHTVLGDVASLMGKYDVKGEEDLIRRVLIGEQDLDDVIASTSSLSTSDDLAGILFRIFDDPEETTQPIEEIPAPTTRTSLYSSEVAYLEDALSAAYLNPTEVHARGGVEWKWHKDFGTAEVVPPRDLIQRLEVLPQSYLQDRSVLSKFHLATTREQGRKRVAAALAEDTKTSWPDAHYLTPLHPILDWAADRALASLGRNEVFAVRGEVPGPTVVLLGTLTNRRGQVVASSWLTALFPDTSNPNFCLVQYHATPIDALTSLGWVEERANPGAVNNVDQLQTLILPAVREAGAVMRTVFAAAEADVSRRVEEWNSRLETWSAEADALIQRQDVRQRRMTINQEQELVELMAPDQQLVRPLLIVTPVGFGLAKQ